MSEQKKSIDNLDQDQTNTDNVKGGFGGHLKERSVGRELEESKYGVKPIINPKRPVKGHDENQEHKSYRK